MLTIPGILYWAKICRIYSLVKYFKLAIFSRFWRSPIAVFLLQGLAQYSDIFLRHEIDLATFATLTDLDLKEIGIQTFGARKKILLLTISKYTCMYVFSSVQKSDIS